MPMWKDLARTGLRAVEWTSVALANVPRRAPAFYKHFKAHDLLKAHRMAARLRPDDVVLDVGCGSGQRLYELGLFCDIEARGVEISRPMEVFPGVKVDTYDGRSLGMPDDSVDVVVICYVLHHLTRDHASALLAEAARVARRSILLLEDTRPAWGALYRLRNLCHRVESDLVYGASGDYVSPGGQQMFLTHAGWSKMLADVPGVTGVELIGLEDISKYAHHTLIEVSLEPA